MPATKRRSRSTAKYIADRNYKKKRSIVIQPKQASTRTPAIAGVRTIAPRAGPANNLYTTFIYSELFNLTNLVGNVAVQQFALSSLFDPNFTGAGTQPVNFDQYALMYEKYLVYEVEVIAHCITIGAQPVIAGVNIQDENATSIDVKTYIQNGQSQWTLQSAAGGTDKSVFKMTVDMAKAHGTTRADLFSNPNYRSNFGASPAEQMFLTCFSLGSDTAVSGTSRWYVELRFKSMLMGSKLNLIS